MFRRKLSKAPSVSRLSVNQADGKEFFGNRKKMQKKGTNDFSGKIGEESSNHSIQNSESKHSLPKLSIDSQR